MNKASPEDIFEAMGGRRESFSSKKTKAQNSGIAALTQQSVNVQANLNVGH